MGLIQNPPARHLPAPQKNRIYIKKRWLPWLPRLKAPWLLSLSVTSKIMLAGYRFFVFLLFIFMWL